MSKVFNLEKGLNQDFYDFFWVSTNVLSLLYKKKFDLRNQNQIIVDVVVVLLSINVHLTLPKVTFEFVQWWRWRVVVLGAF